MTNAIQEILLAYLEPISKQLIFWENDPVRIGKVIRLLHHTFMYMLFGSFILVHTVFPSFFLLCVLYIFCVFIWLHHIITGGCIISKLEQKLIGDRVSFIDPMLELFHIPITRESTVGVTIMFSSLAILILTLEIMCRTSLQIRSYFH